MKNLNKTKPPFVTVLRNGKWKLRPLWSMGEPLPISAATHRWIKRLLESNCAQSAS